MGLSTQDFLRRGSRERFVRASIALGVLGVAVLAAIPVFGTRNRHEGVGACSYEVVGRAPMWMWLAGLTSLALANGALVYARGVRVHDTRENAILGRVLGVALFAAVAWFLWAQWGYHSVSCEY